MGMYKGVEQNIIPFNNFFTSHEYLFHSSRRLSDELTEEHGDVLMVADQQLQLGGRHLPHLHRPSSLVLIVSQSKDVYPRQLML